ncbi:Nucleotide-binding universal stress protein, UspA family [Hymenobacter gelipurpurascens]|uniref:Nucleotide-binding universal stress protein, UspA family n=1 Tax=Hymenobacter gelipurpurascens TaxID=89968 RepID=A0A212T3C0_9BACT|nr:universal stress protein [Hymenobacter gelipurpurascens]SNC60538.1 Nucleotide-binding universal stress protein, UspA family [Hymenobacter gelipurpurascens]
MQNILVPTDFSPEAHNAFEVAMQLASRTGGHITLLHVVDAPRSSGIVSTGGTAGAAPMNGVFMVQLLQRTKRRMHELMAEVASDRPEVPVQDRIATGDIDEAVLDVIRERHIDLVVIGAHVHAPDHSVFGHISHAERLVRLAPCPVLTVKRPAPDFNVHSIVFASDFSAEADRAIPSLRQLCAAFPEAILHLLDVVTTAHNSGAALERIHSFASRHQLAAYEPDVVSAPRVSTGIPRYTDQAHADLVVMLTHGHSGIWHFLQGSIAETVAVQAEAPVLTFHI